MSATARITIEPATAEPAPQEKRRRYSIAEKRRIVEASFEPKTSVARVAREHGVNANQVFSWRRLYQRGRLGGSSPAPTRTELLPVTISEVPAGPTLGGATPAPASFPMHSIGHDLDSGLRGNRGFRGNDRNERKEEPKELVAVAPSAPAGESNKTPFCHAAPLAQEYTRNMDGSL